MNDNPTGKDYVGSDELYADVQRCMQLNRYINEADDYARDFFGSFIHNPSMRFVDFLLYFCSVVQDD